MSENLDSKRVSLASYLANRGFSNQSPEACALLARIYRKEQFALLRLAVPNVPSNPLPEYLREVLTTYTYKEVPAMSDRKMAGEIGKAARGMQADWQYLDRIELVFEEEVTVEHEPAGRVTAYTSHAAKIFKALKQSNYDPLLLPPKEGRKSAARQAARRALVDTGRSGSLSASQFENAWDAALKLGELKYAADHL